MSTDNPTSPVPAADVQHFPAVPSYVVALSVVAAVVVTVLVLFILYSCLMERSKNMVVQSESPTRETEQLREEPAVEHDVPLHDSATVLTDHIKPKPSPSIFSRGDFMMEVLDGVENTTDFSIDRDGNDISHICEADHVTVAMDDLETASFIDDDRTATPILSTPPRQSATMAILLENFPTPTLSSPSNSGWNCATRGLRVRDDCQADASTLALRGSISSGEGGEVVCGEIEIYEDPVESSGEEVEVGIECHEVQPVGLENNNALEKNGSNDKLVPPVEEILNPDEHASSIPEGNLVEDQVELDADEKCPASESIIREDESFPIEISLEDDEFADNNQDDEKYLSTCSPAGKPSPSLTVLSTSLSSNISGQGNSGSNSHLKASTCLPEVVSTPAQTIPVNIIPISDQKSFIPNTLSAQLSHSTPTSLLHPLVSMHTLPLTERAPLSCNSEYSPVYNMQAGSARVLDIEKTIANGIGDRDEVKGNEFVEEQFTLDETDVITPGDSSNVNPI